MVWSHGTTVSIRYSDSQSIIFNYNLFSHSLSINDAMQGTTVYCCCNFSHIFSILLAGGSSWLNKDTNCKNAHRSDALEKLAVKMINGLPLSSS